VRIAVDFDNQPSWQAHEVNDEGPHDVLPAELKARQTLGSQQVPHAAFGRG